MMHQSFLMRTPINPCNLRNHVDVLSKNAQHDYAGYMDYYN